MTNLEISKNVDVLRSLIDVKREPSNDEMQKIAAAALNLLEGFLMDVRKIASK